MEAGRNARECSSSGAANEVAAPLSEKTHQSAAQPASLARKASSDSCRDRKLTRQDQVCRLGPVRNHVSGDQHRLRKRIAQADPSRFLQDDGRLDHSQTTTADILPDRQAKGAKFGERRDGAARTRAAERGPDAVSEAFLFLGYPGSSLSCPLLAPRKAEDALGDDVALNLRTTGVYRLAARGEIDAPKPLGDGSYSVRSPAPE